MVASGCYNQGFININQLSEVLGVSTSTLRNWERSLGLTVDRTSKGNRCYSEETVKIFQEIKKLLVTGKTLDEIKSIIESTSTSFNTGYNNQPDIEIIQENKSDDVKNFDIIIRPFENRISELKSLNDNLLGENKHLIAENATLAERVKNKDEIIQFLQQQKDEIQENLKSALDRSNEKQNVEQTKALEEQNKELKAKLEELENKKWWKFW